jgi:hypothetical protein
MTRRSLLTSLLGSGLLQAGTPTPTPRARVTRTTRIAILNQCSSQNAIGQDVVDAAQKQLDQHFFPAWGLTAELYLANSLGDVADGDLVCTVLDLSDIPGFTGYHRVNTTGRPCAFVFPGSAATFKEPASVVLSHEIMEMLANPWNNATVLYDSGQGYGALYSMEVCDPVQGNTYLIDGVSVANFLTPSYFRAAGAAPYDFLGIIQAPFTTAPYGSQKTRLVNF